MTVTKFQGIKFTFANGDFIIPALSLRQVQQLQGRLAAYNGVLDEQSIELVLDTTHAALSRNYPDLSRDDVSDMVDLRTMGDVMSAVMGVSGLVDAAPSGEATAAA